MVDHTSGNEEVFWMVEARYHFAARFSTASEASAYAAQLNKTSKDRWGHDAYRVVPYTRNIRGIR